MRAGGAGEALSARHQRMGPLKRSRGSMSENRRYGKFSAQQKTELVLASLRGPKAITELCREHDISDSLLGKWHQAAVHLAQGVRDARRSPRGHRRLRRPL